MNLQIQSIVIQSQSVDHSTNKLFEFMTSRHQVHVQTKYFSNSYRGRDRVMEGSRKGKMNINFNKFLQVLVRCEGLRKGLGIIDQESLILLIGKQECQF